MEQFNMLRSRAIPVDLIRFTAISAVILVHSAGHWTLMPQQITQMSTLELFSWGVVDVYQSFASIGAPLFIMLTGALLLQPTKNDSLLTFFKKRWARIGLPFLFWGAAYFVWDFVVVGIPFSLNVIVQGILNGPYTHFWYCYVLIGLYLMTPIIRVFLIQADKTIMKYFLLVWFLGIIINHLLDFLTQYTISGNIFLIGEFLGYFVLGTYLLTIRISLRKIIILMILGFSSTAVTTYLLTVTVGGGEMYLFQQYFSPTVILSSAMVFLLFLKLQESSMQKKSNTTRTSKIIRVVSENTLPLYLFHVMILESIRKGFFGFTINRNVMNPIVDVPLELVIVFSASLGIILLLKKIPYLKRLIG